jgi:hypothetical protein
MARDLVVSVEIDERGKRATFDTNVLLCRPGQTVRWELRTRGRGRGIEQLSPRLRFKELPDTHKPALEGGLQRGTIFRADKGIIRAVVSRRAPRFTYGYVVELVKGGKPTALSCVWKPTGVRRGAPIVMAGIDPSGGGKK